MEYKINAKPDYAFLTVQLNADEKLKVEASSMASMDPQIKMTTKLKGGLSRILSKETLFINEFVPHGHGGEITIAPGPSGDIGHYDIKEGEEFFITASSFLASADSVKQETKWQGFTKGFFSGESFFLIRNTGIGDIWFNCYGALFEVNILDEYIVDTGHIVAFTSGLDYNVERLGGYKSFFFSGEGFVARFRGQGKVWVQTKSSVSLVSWADQFRRIEKTNKK